ncbi:TPA: restriction endonuclease subunit S [Xanthomonas vasicola pv. zeae]|nr:restriction endonuclease subunit S [Xanthomonas vasicola pv. zeae]HHZ28595.1 restriction endonuclease subunit S [Xanthomonas vasicola pv. zeae]HHZ35583.1 restriction endonuclease subunit S [Xanthomonas vasicola pv. zeae]HHZ39344.1 restriction endonuclease subunit S [Xanthomonas vasicola pv. zeae]HHZ44053.1 restriction endonuclease subunit S [Xanthomonas vasicola pv. zeae]
MSELPAGWAETSLGAIGSVQSGMGFPLEMQGQTEGEYPVYKVGDISRGVLLDEGILRRSTNYVDAEAAAVLKGHIFPEGSILFAKIGEALRLNRRAIIFREGLADNNVMGFKAAQGIDDGFLYHFLRTQDLASLSRSTTIPSIRKSDVEDITISLPPLAEQKRIAQKLDALLAQVDTLKARIDAIPTLLKRFRKAVRASALKGDLLSDSKEDSSAWNECTLSDLASVETGKTPDRSEANYWQAGSIPWVTSAATGLSFCKEAKEFVTPLALRECSLKLFSPGTLLLAMYGEGKTRGQVTELKIQAACNQACAAISVNGELALQSFVKLRLEENYEAIRKMAVGGNQPNLNLGKVREIQFSLPSIATQTEIVLRVEQLFAYADQLEAKVAAAKQRIDALTQSLLAKAFRGELVPQDPTDEPASVLLERIRAKRAATPKPKRGRKAATR